MALAAEPLVRKRLTQAELDVICARHDRLFQARPGGARAVFAWMDLSGLSLKGRNLADADFARAGRSQTYNRALSLAATGDYPLAVAYFDAVLFANPADSQARDNRAVVDALVEGVVGQANAAGRIAATATGTTFSLTTPAAAADSFWYASRRSRSLSIYDSGTRASTGSSRRSSAGPSVSSPRKVATASPIMRRYRSKPTPAM